MSTDHEMDINLDGLQNLFYGLGAAALATVAMIASSYVITYKLGQQNIINNNIVIPADPTTIGKFNSNKNFQADFINAALKEAKKAPNATSTYSTQSEPTPSQ